MVEGLPVSFLYFPPVPQSTVITTKAPASVSSEVRDSHQTRKSWYMSVTFRISHLLAARPRKALHFSGAGVPSAVEAGYLPWGSLSASLSGDCALSPCPPPMPWLHHHSCHPKHTTALGTWMCLHKAVGLRSLKIQCLGHFDYEVRDNNNNNNNPNTNPSLTLAMYETLF